MSRIEFHWPSRMRPLACVNSKIVILPKRLKNRIRDWGNSSLRTRRRTRWGRSWSKSWPSSGRWTLILSRSRLKMAIWKMFSKPKMTWESLGIRRSPICLPLPARPKWSPHSGWPATWKQLQPKMIRLGRRRKRWRTKWSTGRQQSFNSCFQKLIKIESRTRWKFNSLTIRLRKFTAITNSLNRQIKKYKVKSVKIRRSSSAWRSRRISRRRNCIIWLSSWIRRLPTIMICCKIKLHSLRSLKKTCWGWRVKLSHFKIRLTSHQAFPIITTRAITREKSANSNHQSTSRDWRERTSRSTWRSRALPGPNCLTNRSRICWGRLTRSISRGASLKFRILWCRLRRRRMRLPKSNPKSTRSRVRKRRKSRTRNWTC